MPARRRREQRRRHRPIPVHHPSRGRVQIGLGGRPIGDRRVADPGPQVEHRIGRQPQAGHPGHQRGDLGQAQVLAAALGQKVAEGIVESPSRRCRPAGFRRRGGPHAARAVATGHADLDRACR